MNKSVFTTMILCIATLSSFGQYGYYDSWDSRPAQTRRDDGWGQMDVNRIAKHSVYGVAKSPGFRRSMAKGVKNACKGLKAIGLKALFIGIGAAIVGFFKELAQGKKRHLNVHCKSPPSGLADVISGKNRR